MSVYNSTIVNKSIVLNVVDIVILRGISLETEVDTW